jgi:hypothetical protein
MRALLLACAVAGVAAVPVAAHATVNVPASSVLPVQRLQRDTGPRATLTTEHFDISYNSERLNAAQATAAGKIAEAGWKRCEELFLGKPEFLKGRIRLNLTPNFLGATGFATPPDSEAGSAPLIGVRYADLEYLGLTGDYVLTHEIAHVFSGVAASTSLGEGIADWAAGEYSGLPMRPWWGVTLQKAGLWIEPDAFFITGDFPARPEVDEVIRTSQYVESGLLVRYLVGRFGWEKVRQFAGEYSAARGTLESNADRAERPAPRSARGRANDPRRPPDATAVRATFQKAFGESWEQLRAAWEREMTAETPPADQAARLVLGQRIYGTVRNFEMWTLRSGGISSEASSVVRAAFTEANRSLLRGDLTGANVAYQRARGIVERLRRPQIIALAATQ